MGTDDILLGTTLRSTIIPLKGGVAELSLVSRVHNRFGGMRDLANFCVDFRDGSWKREREAGISIANGSGILGYQGVGMRESQEESSEER